MATNKLTVLAPSKPNVDIWKSTYMEIMRRGGLAQLRPDRLWMTWQKSHVRAHRNENNRQRNWRRGNNSADWFANRGRELHHDISNIVANVKYISDRV